MTVYAISEVEMRNLREFEAMTIARYGERYLVRGARPSSPKAIVVEFPSIDGLKQWYASSE